MLAFLFCLALFSLWTAVGYALLRLLDFTRNRLQSLLIAPPIGLIGVVLPVFVLNRMGIPCRQLAMPLTVGLAIFAAWRIWRDCRGRDKRSGTGLVRQYGLFAVLLFVALILTGRPMFAYGFDWISYCNDDMANYTLAAERFLNFGFFHPPSVDSLANGLDYSQSFWFMHARDGQRPGCELILAWAAGTSGLGVHDVFMPVIVAMHLALVSVAAGAIYRFRRRYWAAAAAMVLVGTSALTTFGTMYQLIAQVCGLGVLIASMVLLIRPLHTMRWSVAWRYGILLGLLAATFLIIYPELTPFLALTFILYHLLQIIRRRGRAPWKRLGVVAGITVVAAGSIMGVYSINSFYFILSQAAYGSAQFANQHAEIHAKLFPFYLIPSGLANLWNLQIIASITPEPWMSGSIAIGMVLTLFVLVASVIWAWKGEPLAVLTFIMLGTGAQLFVNGGAFGLYKLAMFLQPFLLGMAVLAWWAMARRGNWVVRWAPVVLMAVGSGYVQKSYVRESSGSGTFSNIRDASKMHITRVLRETIARLDPESIVTDSSNLSLAKIEAIYTRGIETAYPTHDYLGSIRSATPGNRVRSPKVVQEANNLLQQLRLREFTGHFDFKDGKQNEPFIYQTLGMIGGNPINSQYLLASGGRISVLNRFAHPPDKAHPFVVMPMDEVRNHLVFTYTKFGLPYFGELVDDDKISFFPVENDPMIKDGHFAGIGRYLLFEVLHPTPGARLELNITATLKADGQNELPPAAVVGTERTRLGLVGSGAARVFSEPVMPQIIGGRTYILLDMGEYGTRFPYQRTGLMWLWGRNVLFDARKMVVFARNISLVSNEDYRALKAPQSVARFPDDLLNPQLEFSGVYEKDGWVSDHSFFMLDPAGAGTVVVKGQIPMIDDKTYSTMATLLVDGKVIMQRSLQLGEFELSGPIPPGKGRRRVELTFDRAQQLPNGDNRPIGAQIFFMGFNDSIPETKPVSGQR